MTALVAGTMRRHLAEMRRYAFDTIMQFSSLVVAFALLFYGAKAIGGTSVHTNGTLPSIVSFFIVFTVVIASFFSLTTWVTNEALLGTLEQLEMSPFGLTRILLVEYAASIGWTAWLTGIMGLLAMTISGEWLHFDLLTLAPLVGVLVAQILGVALIASGLALIFKRVAALLNLVQFAFMALIAAPVSRSRILELLPIALASSLIRRSTVDHTALSRMSGDAAIAAAVAAGYLVAGLVVFGRCDRVARERGLVGQH